MRIGILGATGMLGHHAAIAARAAGHELVVLHRAGSRVDRLGDLAFEPRTADLDDARSLTPALRGLDGVINAAAYYPTLPRPWRAEVAAGLKQMGAFYDACAEAKVPRVLYLGGAIALPRRLDGAPGDESLIYPAQPADRNPYLQVKWAMDELARRRAAEGLPVVIGIPTMSFGEYDYGPTTGRFIVEIANRTMGAFVPGRRNAVYAGDAGRGLVLALEKGRAGERYLLGGANVGMDQLVALIAALAKVPPPRPVPLGVARIVAALQAAKWRLFGGEPPRLSATAIAVMASGQFLDGAKARRELGYEPQVTLPEALTRALKWFREAGYVSERA
jgi:dihydroflavonol-4-reductase